MKKWDYAINFQNKGIIAEYLIKGGMLTISLKKYYAKTNKW